MSQFGQPAAFEHNAQPVARKRFYEIACDPRRSVAVEACAGAGKTWMLVSRIVRALLDGSASHQILAITFTKKAAGEMRERLHEWLLQFSQSTDAQLEQELLSRGFTQAPAPEQLAMLRSLHLNLLRHGRPVQIRTFHSWFAALLRSAPLGVLHQMGLPSAYELLENDAKAVAQVWRLFLTRVAKDAMAHADYMAAVAVYGRHQTHKALEAALSKRVEFALADAHGVVDASVQTFAQQFPEFGGLQTPQDYLNQAITQTLLLDAARALGASSLVSCTKAATALEQALGNHDVAGMFDALLTKTGTARKFSDKLTGIATVQAAQDALLRVSAAKMQHEAWLHQQRMARLSRGLLEDYAGLKRERRWIDMGDLERAALTLMSDPVLSGWVQERLDAQVRHLLIDEFQDTNPLQWQALSAWLQGYGGAARAPSVFIVGDPKQSIYRFRRAEPQVFMAAKRFVVDGLGGDVLSCDHTRRNAPAIIQVVNQALGQAQADGQFDGYRPHSTESTDLGRVFKLPRLTRETGELDAVESTASEWRDSLTTPRHTQEETRKTMECRQAARWLAQQLHVSGGSLQAKDIMVLARKRERLGLMQSELAALHIAAQQPEKTELGDMPEVQDIVALLDALVSPRHDLSLARALKSPLFRVGDEDLVQLVLCQRGLPQPEDSARASWFDTLQEATGLPQALSAIGPILLRWRAWLQGTSPHDAISRIYHDGDVLARFAAAARPKQRESVLANLRALLSATLQLDGGRYVTAYALVRALKAGGIAAPVRADTQSVRLLTVHGAKGLEAPLVLLLDTDSEALKSETMGALVQWPGEDAYPKRFVFLASETRPPACVADALAQEQMARKREELNALYVALTRTQRTLVLSSLEPHAPQAGSWWQRLEGMAENAPWADGAALEAADPLLVGAATSPGTSELGDIVALSVLPNMPQALVDKARDATEKIARLAKIDRLDSRMGQAMHRLLEWVEPAQTLDLMHLWSDAQRARVALEFGLTQAQVLQAQHMAVAIVGGQGAWAWNSGLLAWHGNEVAMVCAGKNVRIDRLVRRADSGQWWVFDYKSAFQPQHQVELLAQLEAYRSGVSLANPGHTVRAAFLTPQGALIEI
ncbi:UvrD-helicase domain-containing protein [Rhodoferax aquaticus]|uniref:DNA 3'-5' helicase n=1 Tax=Rhodoferax aquaticus TaxID=2527691 RepID=A0A515EQF8_9BURK|nr:UvrD-helicase domain-containing protein [Rhodoferax aquaticus]QDL54879.1 DNA helicase UvrD [Rhodoferax aquaticus]